MTRPEGERLAVVENDLKHLTYSFEQHRLDTRAAVERADKHRDAMDIKLDALMLLATKGQTTLRTLWVIGGVITVVTGALFSVVKWWWPR